MRNYHLCSSILCFITISFHWTIFYLHYYLWHVFWVRWVHCIIKRLSQIGYRVDTNKQILFQLKRVLMTLLTLTENRNTELKANEKNTYYCILEACYRICQLTNDEHCIWKFFIRDSLRSNIILTSTGLKDTRVGRCSTFAFDVTIFQSLIHSCAKHNALRTFCFRGRCDLICWTGQTSGEGIIQRSLCIQILWRKWFGVDW